MSDFQRMEPSKEQLARIQNAADRFARGVKQVVEEMIPGQPDEVKLQLMTGFALGTLQISCGRSFDPGADEAIASGFYEALLLGFGTGIASLLSPLDVMQRGAAMQTIIGGTHHVLASGPANVVSETVGNA